MRIFLLDGETCAEDEDDMSALQTKSDISSKTHAQLLEEWAADSFRLTMWALPGPIWFCIEGKGAQATSTLRHALPPISPGVLHVCVYVYVRVHMGPGPCRPRPIWARLVWAQI